MRKRHGIRVAALARGKLGQETLGGLQKSQGLVLDAHGCCQAQGLGQTARGREHEARRPHEGIELEQVEGRQPVDPETPCHERAMADEGLMRAGEPRPRFGQRQRLDLALLREPGGRAQPDGEGGGRETGRSAEGSGGCGHGASIQGSYTAATRRQGCSGLAGK